MTLKAYKHVGACPLVIDGHEVEPGTARFEAHLPAELEIFLLGIGAIEILPGIRPIVPATNGSSTRGEKKE